MGYILLGTEAPSDYAESDAALPCPIGICFQMSQIHALTMHKPQIIQCRFADILPIIVEIYLSQTR